MAESTTISDFSIRVTAYTCPDLLRARNQKAVVVLTSRRTKGDFGGTDRFNIPVSLVVVTNIHPHARRCTIASIERNRRPIRYIIRCLDPFIGIGPVSLQRLLILGHGRLVLGGQSGIDGITVIQGRFVLRLVCDVTKGSDSVHELFYRGICRYRFRCLRLVRLFRAGFLRRLCPSWLFRAGFLRRLCPSWLFRAGFLRRLCPGGLFRAGFLRRLCPGGLFRTGFLCFLLCIGLCRAQHLCHST